MNGTPRLPIHAENPQHVTNDVLSNLSKVSPNTHLTASNTLTEMCNNCTSKENGALCGMSKDETCNIDNHVLDYQTLKLATGANGYVKYNNGDNGLTSCLQNHIHTVLESQKENLLTGELTESSHSGSTVATEESMVSSLSDEKIYTDTGTSNECVDCRCSQSKSCLCEHFYNLCIEGPSTSKHYRDIRDGIEYVVYKSEKQMPDIMRLITKDLSEPYSIYTYRYFIHNWPKLCFLSMDGDTCIGAIVCKLDMHKKMVRRGYIAMLAIDSKYRRRKIGSNLVLKAIDAMVVDDCDEVVLETEITNQGALHLYEKLGFVRDKRLFHYYLNGVDALRLKLWLR